MAKKTKARSKARKVKRTAKLGKPSLKARAKKVRRSKRRRPDLLGETAALRQRLAGHNTFED